MIWQGLFHLHHTKLLLLHMTLKTFADLILHSILAEVLLCIRLAMALIADYQLEDTCCQCCFASIDSVCSAGDIIAVGVVVAEVLALEVHPHANEGALLLVVALSELLFLVRSIVAWPELSWSLPFFWPSTRVRVTCSRFPGGGVLVHPRWLLRSLLLSLAADLLELQFLGAGLIA
jgi:hypothetical protein